MTPTEQAKTMSMVERVARAICAPFDPDEMVFLGRYMRRWESHEASATAAIWEVRAHLCDHGATYDMAGKSADYCEGFAAAMVAMAKRFDAALSEEGE